MPLDLLLLAGLALATVAVWWRVWVTRPLRRPRRPVWGPRLEARRPLCELCGRGGHTAQEHVRVPQAELESWGPGHSGASRASSSAAASSRPVPPVNTLPSVPQSGPSPTRV
jgi:hypothetical protein